MEIGKLKPNRCKVKANDEAKKNIERAKESGWEREMELETKYQK